MSICYYQVFVQNTFRILIKNVCLEQKSECPFEKTLNLDGVFLLNEEKNIMNNTANQISIAIGYFHGNQCENIYRTNTNIFYETKNCSSIYLTSHFKSFIHFLHMNACRHCVLIQLNKVKDSFISLSSNYKKNSLVSITIFKYYFCL